MDSDWWVSDLICPNIVPFQSFPELKLTRIQAMNNVASLSQL